ncbi:MAG: hypothetical protein ACWGPN_14245, partial [Gammaproteobacteria bacterium]
ANTGEQLWRFHTVAVSTEPGGDTWGDLPDLYRAGGETWITGSYDPELNLTYWGTAQAKPWMPASRGMDSRAVGLYTSSTVALDARTGELEWYFAHAPGEALDLDVVFERVLVDSGDDKWVFTVGKDGVLWKVDRTTGSYIDHVETVFQNVWASFDRETGRPTYRDDILDHEVGEWVDGCPSTEGGHNWQAMSFHKPSRRLVIPLSQSCISIRAQAVERDEARQAQRGLRVWVDDEGMVVLAGRLPPEQGALVLAAIERAEAELVLHREPSPTVDDGDS